MPNGGGQARYLQNRGPAHTPKWALFRISFYYYFPVLFFKNDKSALFHFFHFFAKKEVHACNFASRDHLFWHPKSFCIFCTFLQSRKVVNQGAPYWGFAKMAKMQKSGQKQEKITSFRMPKCSSKSRESSSLFPANSCKAVLAILLVKLIGLAHRPDFRAHFFSRFAKT